MRRLNLPGTLLLPTLLLTTMLLLMGAAWPASLPAQDAKADESTKQDEKPTPKQVVASFYGHLAAGESEKAKELVFTPIHDPMVAPHLDRILELLTVQHKESGKVHIFDTHIIENLAGVIRGTEGDRFNDKIDIDPMFLRKTDGDWKLILANSAKGLKQHELPEKELQAQADSLIEWYEKREESVREEWRKREKKTS